MYYFQRVEERSKQARKALKNCELATKTEKIRIQGSSDQQSRRMYRVQKSG